MKMENRKFTPQYATATGLRELPVRYRDDVGDCLSLCKVVGKFRKEYPVTESKKYYADL